MAGIKANSASQTMGDGDTAADKTVSGYLVREQIILSTYPTAAAYSWALAAPAGSSSSLSDDDIAQPTIKPDLEGQYLVTVTVTGGTTYQIRIGVLNVATSENVQLLRLNPVADASVPAPATGVLTLYNSSTQGGLAVKDENDAVSTVDVTPV